MNTIVLTGRETIAAEERPMPSPGPGEMVIAVVYCGICRTDRKCYRQGQRDLHLPRVLGHEFSGVIAAVGEGVAEERIGERVTVHPGIACAECAHCRSGNDQCCREMKILGFHLDGGFSRYCLIPADGVKNGIVRPVPDHVPLRHAAMCEPLGCVVHMIRQMDPKNTDSALILGGGVLGFMMAMLLRHYGVRHIVISEPNEKKRKLLRRRDYIACLPEKNPELMEDIGVSGFDAAIPCAPYSECFAQAVNSLKNDGFFGFFSGLIDGGAITAKVLNQIHYKELSVKGVYGCGTRDTAEALRLMADGFDLSALPVTTVGLGEAENVLKQTETENAFLTMIEYEGGNAK